MNDPELFYWGAIIWLSGFFGGCSIWALLTILGLKRGWIVVKNTRFVDDPSQGARRQNGPARASLGAAYTSRASGSAQIGSADKPAQV
jgi:hypothetical protein